MKESLPLADVPAREGAHGIRMRLGVMGGSFDPVHVAHLVVAETVRETLGLDLVLFVPVGEQPLKERAPIAPAAHRVAMLELALAGNPRFAISRVDVDRPSPSYTIDTLRLLRQEWGAPEATAMWFVVGTDSLATFPRWREPEAILGLTRLAAVKRPGAAVDLAGIEAHIPGLGAQLDWIDAPLIEISATDLRRRIGQGQSIRYRVPEPVREYIEANDLYR